MTSWCGPLAPQAAPTAKIADAIRDLTKLRGEVTIMLPSALPNDGKVIADARSYR
jgi:phenylacetate-CoA ligase